MSYTTIFTSDYGNTISVRRDDQYLTIRSESPINSEPVYIYIPHDEADDFFKRFDRAVSAPAWTRAQFVRVEPKGFAPYAMFRRPDGRWVTDSGHVLTTKSFLECTDPIVFEVIA